MKIYSIRSSGLVFISSIILIFVWFILSIAVDNELYLPSPLETFKYIFVIAQGEGFLINIISTLVRTCVAFVVALAIALVCGVVVSKFKFFYSLLQPIIYILGSVPTMVLVVMLLIWFDKSMVPYIIGFVVAFPIIYESVKSSILNIDINIINVLKVYDVPIKKRIGKVYMPSILYGILNIFISTISLVLKVVIAGELFGQPSYGIGTVIYMEKVYLNTVGIFAWIVIIAILSMVFKLIDMLIKTYFIRWRTSYD